MARTVPERDRPTWGVRRAVHGLRTGRNAARGAPCPAADTDKRSSNLDGNGLVDVADLRVVIDALSSDGVDNAAAMEDLLAVLSDWGSDTWDLRLEEFGLSRDRIVDLGTYD